MVNQRFSTSIAFLLLFVPPWLVTAPALAQDEAQTLDRAIQLFDQGEYVSAQELLLGIDRDKLTTQQQSQRDYYLDRVQVAIPMYEKALRDLEDAETAIAEGERQRAEHLLNAVVENEYAAEVLRRTATAHLNDLKQHANQVDADKPEPTPTSPPEPARREPSAPPPADSEPKAVPTPPDDQPQPVVAADSARAQALTERGDRLVVEGRFDEAQESYAAALEVVPGYPEAVEGLNRIRQHLENLAGPTGQSLIDRMRREDMINWQRAVTQYREIEWTIRDHLLANRFDEARQLLVRAHQIVESGKQFADPVTKYENLRSELEALENQIAVDERTYNEQKVAEIRRDIEMQRNRKLREVEERRARQVDSLIQQAMQHRKDGDFAAAVNVLRQVTGIDPKNQPARWLMDLLEDQMQYRRDRENRDRFYRQSRGALQDVEEAKTPWWKPIHYPDDWPEIISRPERQIPGRSGQEGLLFGALEGPIRVDFKNAPFQQVIERLADTHQLNIIVNWRNLEDAGVQRDVSIDLNLPNEISLRKALTEVLDQAGAGVADLGFDVADGAITVATQRSIDMRTYPAVYPIADLLMEVPNFTDGPISDLRVATEEGRRSAEREDAPWQWGDDDDNEPEEDPDRAGRVQQIIEIIQETVAPDSWRDRGGSIGTIKEINGQLVITQNSAAQRQIGGLLDKLREQRAIQIAVESVFLTVSSHYLEELGIDVDIVLNSGNAGFDFLDGGAGPMIDPVLGTRVLLPRTFSRLGFTSEVPTEFGGAELTPSLTSVPQPYGLPFVVPQSTGGGGSQVTPVPIASGMLDLTNPSALASDVPGSFAGQSLAPALSVFGSFLDNIQVDFLIRATQADSRTSVLTAPRVVVPNGGNAWVAVTLQQNYVSELQPIAAQEAIAQQPTVSTIDAGASLFVRATVTADKRYVMMLLAPSVSRLLDLQTFSFSGGTAGGFALPAFLQIPTVSRQTLRTMVSVPDGGTLLIGGQKLASDGEIEAGVPILSKIPILKRLYSSRSMIKDEQTLLILIKPKILIQSEQEELAFPSFRQG